MLSFLVNEIVSGAAAAWRATVTAPDDQRELREKDCSSSAGNG